MVTKGILELLYIITLPSCFQTFNLKSDILLTIFLDYMKVADKTQMDQRELHLAPSFLICDSLHRLESGAFILFLSKVLYSTQYSGRVKL